MSFCVVATQKLFKFVLKPFLLDTRPHTYIQWLTLACVFHNVIPQMMYLCYHVSELTEKSDLMIFSTFSTLTFINVSYLMYKRRELCNYLAKQEVAVKFRAMPAHKSLFAVAELKTSRRLMLVIFSTCMFALYILSLAGMQFYHFVSGTATEATYKLPFAMHFFFDSSARGLFHLSFLTTTISSLVAAMHTLVIDGLYFTFCYQIEALYLCLGQDFREIDNMFGYSELSAVRQRLVEQKMQLLMYQHGQYVEIITLAEEFFQPLLLLKFLSITLNLALVVYEATNSSFEQIIVPLINGFFSIIHVYLCCSAGSIVTDASDGFATVVYNGHWYDYPMWAKRYVCMIGGMSRKTSFRVGSSVNCDQSLFSVFLQFSYSGYSFLRSLK